MLNRRTDRDRFAAECRNVDRVVDGTVGGRRETWVVVSRNEAVFGDWFERDLYLPDEVPPVVCRSILEDGTLVLESVRIDDDPDIDEFEPPF